MNTVKTGMLLAALTALFGVVGYMLGGGDRHVDRAWAFGVATNLFAYWNSDRLALAAHHAMEVDERTAPDLVRMVRDLAAASRPAACRGSISSTTRSRTPSRPGATRRTAAVAATTGLLHMLSRDEIGGRDGARTGAYQEPRYPDHDRERHHRGRHREPGAIRVPVRRPGRRSAQRRRHAAHGPHRAAGRHDHPDGDQPVAGI